MIIQVRDGFAICNLRLGRYRIGIKDEMYDKKENI